MPSPAELHLSVLTVLMTMMTMISMVVVLVVVMMKLMMTVMPIPAWRRCYISIMKSCHCLTGNIIQASLISLRLHMR